MDYKSKISDGFRGCISIMKAEEVLFEEVSGYADLANKIPNTMNTKYATASAGKAFVAVAILMLIEKNVLRLDQTLEECLDTEFGQIDPDITVRQLLTHTSGIPDYFDESTMDDYEDLWKDYPNYKIRKNADIIPLFINKPMMYPRGEKFLYNNTGFVVLAMIIEQVTGLPFDEYLKENIFIPCEMKDTGYYELDRLPATCAHNYIYDSKRDEYRTNIYSVDAKGTGAGGAFTTIPDVLKFWDCLIKNQLLSKDMTNSMVSKQVEDENYGYGLWLGKSKYGMYAPCFQGSDPGVSFITSYDIEKQAIIVIVSNFGDNVWEIWRNIKNEMDEMPQ